MERKIITEGKKNILKEMESYFEPTMADNRIGYLYDTPVFSDLCKLVEADYDTLCRLQGVYSGEIIYNSEYGKYIATCLVKKEGCIVEGLSVELESDEDFLGLFEKKEKEADTSLENFFNDSLENVVRKLRETYPDVVENIEQNVISHIRGYDLDDSDIEYFADDWIKDNPRIAVDEAESYLTEEEQADIVKEWSDSLSSEDTKDLIVRLIDNL
jgi:hypothetical protein